MQVKPAPRGRRETASKSTWILAGEPMKILAAAFFAVLLAGSALLADAATETAATSGTPAGAARGG